MAHTLIFFFLRIRRLPRSTPLSLHDALPISRFSRNLVANLGFSFFPVQKSSCTVGDSLSEQLDLDRKSTRLNSSHLGISYAVFCLKKKKPYGLGLRHPRMVKPRELADVPGYR